MERIERKPRHARFRVMAGDTCCCRWDDLITLTCTSREGYTVYYSYVNPDTGELQHNHCDYSQWGSKTYMGDDAVWALGHIKFLDYENWDL